MDKIPDRVLESLNALSCEDVAEKLGMDVISHRALCFMHDDHHPSLHFWGRNREKWWCLVCNKGGTAINLVMEYAGIGFVEACQWLGTQFNINVGGTMVLDIKRTPIKRQKRKSYNKENPFSKNIAHWILDNCTLMETGVRFLYEQRKLNPDVISQLNIVSLEDSRNLVDRLRNAFGEKMLKESGLVSETNGKIYFRMFTPCLLFPYYDKERVLTGLQSRYLGNNKNAPRFQFVSAQKARVFNMPIVNNMSYGDELYISEGITDCLALLSAGKKAVAIPSASILPVYDLMDLSKFRLHMYPDQDDAGRKAFSALRRFFTNHYAILREELLPKGTKDFSEYYVMSHGKE